MEASTDGCAQALKFDDTRHGIVQATARMDMNNPFVAVDIESQSGAIMSGNACGDERTARLLTRPSELRHIPRLTSK